MADVRPFPAIHYNLTKIGDLSKVITQPYDKVTPEMRERYLQQHQFSFINLILPKSEDPYTTSANTCNRWLAEGILVRETKPAFYILEEEFDIEGRRMRRKGFIGAIRVEEFEKGTVLPHEFTHSGPKADRLALLRATKKDYEQIFFLYPDPKGEIERLLDSKKGAEPDLTATDEFGVVHRLWQINDQNWITALRQAMQGQVVLIADGHHRYETALNYRREMEQKGNVPASAALRFKTAAFFKITDPGLVILPTHRLLKTITITPDEALSRLNRLFEVRLVPDESAKSELEKHKSEHAFVAYFGKGKSYLLLMRDPEAAKTLLPAEKSPEYKELDVALLHALIIDNVFGIKPAETENRVLYERYWQDTVARVDSGAAACALFLNPTRPEQVQKLAEKMERMPQKSTDFFPKLISGMVFMDVAETEVLPD
ncbi:MAG: DUF1015 domain-containing protein [candidate division WOR-3 bacterium]|jgi:uncharacterized protein (DUF1015 family)|nr:DUF1015 domain-containing protein [candidate division WOR-3 bacterium]MDH7519231.1 DUF1015 domain-containing protein [bacterium]